MHCPYCGTMVVQDSATCVQCGSQIVWEGGEATFATPESFAPVFTAWEASSLPVIESLLAANNIPFVVANEAIQDVVGLGRAGVGYNPIVGPPVVRVPSDREAEARELIAAAASAPSEAESAGE